MKTLTDLVSKELGNRKTGITPFCAYRPLDWFHFFRLRYQFHTGEEYSYRNHKNQIGHLGSLYGTVFNELHWSALDFARFIDEIIIQSSIKAGKHPSLLPYQKKKEKTKSIILQYSKKLEKDREENYFKGLIYVPFYPLRPNQRDLGLFFSYMNFPKIVFNYGLVNYQRYIQIEKNISLQKAIQETKTEFLIFLKEIKDFKLTMEKVIKGTIRNTLMWEPYSNHKQRVSRGENDIIMNWREIFEVFIKYYKLEKKLWWRDKSFTYRIPQIKAVEEFFKTA